MSNNHDSLLIIDGHEDIAWNALELNRNYLQSVAAGRRAEENSPIPTHIGERLLGLPEWIEGNVALIFATLFVTPANRAEELDQHLVYHTPEEAQRLCLQELQYYQRLTEQTSACNIVTSWQSVEEVLASWKNGNPTVGFVLLMEGADGILKPIDAAEWYEKGLRIIGLAWSGTRYAGGTGAPGGLTALGYQLLDVMQEFNYILDLSHCAERAYMEAVDHYDGTLIVSHANPRRFLPTDRGLSDEMIKRLIERDGVIGVIPYNRFLNAEWQRGEAREKVTLRRLIEAIDYICQIAGDAQHAAIGSDFDGGFGLDSIPSELNSIADLAKIGTALYQQGYSSADVEAILNGNWLRMLKKSLPQA